MKLLLNCDQVFDVLTRGPFPTGEPGDEAVEHHLRACHDCRRLAEALRPAVALMHEAVTADQAIALPEYLGSLPERQPLPAGSQRPQASGEREFPEEQRAQTRSLRQGMRLLTPASHRPRGARRSHLRFADVLHLMAALVLVAALGLVFYGAVISAGLGQPRSIARTTLAPTVQPKSLPDAQGLLTLASLKLPAACFPASYVPVSENDAATLVAAMAGGSLEGLHCCTECHHAGGQQGTSTKLVTVAQQNCHACHRS